MKIQSIILVATVLMLTACEKTVLLDLEQAPIKVVIEGLVTNQHGYQFVKISRSTKFYASGATPRITNAFVTVSDDDGNEFIFVHNPSNHPDSSGYYLPQTPFTGVIGKTYLLHVNVNGEIFEAQDKLFPVTIMDSLKYRINTREKRDPKIDNRFYELLMYTKEPQESDDFYLFKFYRNDTLNLYNPSDIYFSDDKTLAEEINGIPSPVYFELGDSARVEVYSLSRTGFVFFNDLSNLINNDGGMFSPPPANSRTNLSNGALGFFQVSALNVTGLRVKEE
jgi:hypothetical protein